MAAVWGCAVRIRGKSKPILQGYSIESAHFFNNKQLVFIQLDRKGLFKKHDKKPQRAVDNE